MTAFAKTLTNPVARDTFRIGPGAVRTSAVAALLAATVAVPDGMSVAGSAIADAYLQVSVFVAATLIVLFSAERLFRSDLGELLVRHRNWQVPAGALLGGLPGCGGAIVAVTQFTSGRLSFGGVVATLTATMGDAMFLLLAREPLTAGVVFGISMVAGILTGYAVDAIHGARFLHRDTIPQASNDAARWFDGTTTPSEKLWYFLLAPGLVLGVLGAFQVEIEHPAVAGIGIVGALLSVAMWVNRGGERRDCENGKCQTVSIGRKLIDDTNFITGWVVFAFVGYELIVAATGVDLAAAFSVVAVFVPAIAILVGFVPGCGPQILTTSLYLDGSVPLSAQLGNAISNDGDALFPAIAKAPRAAMLATLYSAVPAFIVAYGAYALGW